MKSCPLAIWFWYVGFFTDRMLSHSVFLWGAVCIQLALLFCSMRNSWHFLLKCKGYLLHKISDSQTQPQSPWEKRQLLRPLVLLHGISSGSQTPHEYLLSGEQPKIQTWSECEMNNRVAIQGNSYSTVVKKINKYLEVLPNINMGRWARILFIE